LIVVLKKLKIQRNSLARTSESGILSSQDIILKSHEVNPKNKICKPNQLTFKTSTVQTIQKLRISIIHHFPNTQQLEN